VRSDPHRLVASGRALLLGGALVASSVGAATLNAGGVSAAGSVPAFGHVFLVIGENTAASQLNSGNAPYLLGQVEPNSAWLTNYFAITHYSEANYVAMTSGQFTPCEQKDGSVASCHQDVPNLFHSLDVAGVSWQSWMESMPSPCFLTSAGGDGTLNHYAPKHNPALIYDDVEGTAGVWTDPGGPECQANDIAAGTTGPNDMSTFNAALAAGNVARFNLVVPNECEDAHTNCKPAGNPITQFDDFLAREVPLIEASPAFGTDGVIIITFDEGLVNSPNRSLRVQNGGNVAFAVISPLAHNAVYQQMFTHYSLLRTLQDGFAATGGGYLGAAASASSITPIW
jgi:phosphatidylinositol-3-phosphatase